MRRMTAFHSQNRRKEKPAVKAAGKQENKSQTIFGNADEKPKEKAEKVSVSINTSANMTFKQKVKQYG